MPRCGILLFLHMHLRAYLFSLSYVLFSVLFVLSADSIIVCMCVCDFMWLHIMQNTLYIQMYHTCIRLSAYEYITGWAPNYLVSMCTGVVSGSLGSSSLCNCRQTPTADYWHSNSWPTWFLLGWPSYLELFATT